MTKESIIELLKVRLGITSETRDFYLLHIVESVMTMLSDEKEINVDLSNANIVGFIVNYSAWIYESKGEQAGMPRHLQFALHNLMIHNGKEVAEGV